MKKLLTILAALALFATARAQVPSYGIITNSLGTNYIGPTSNLAPPFLISSTVTTNAGTSNVWYTVSVTDIQTNTFVNITNAWTTGSTNIVYTTNTFSSSNIVVGLSTQSWVVIEPIRATNTIAYTNILAGGTNYANGKTNTFAGSTNIAYLYRNYNVPITFTQIGTNSYKATNNVYGASSIDCTRAKNIASELSFKLLAVGTNAIGDTNSITMTVAPSLDGINPDTSQLWSASFAPNGATTVRYTTNFNMGAYGYLIVVGITNPNPTNAVSGLLLRTAVKASTP